MKKDFSGIEIFLGYSCNQKCRFCFQKDLREIRPGRLDSEEVRRLIYEGFVSGKREVFFSGGDPMLDKDIMDYISYSKDIGYENIIIHTNGIILSDMKIFRECVQRGMNGTIISIHGYGKIHDILVGVDGAFDKLKMTLINFLKLKKEYPELILDSNTVLNRYNYKSLLKIFMFLSKFGVTRSQLVQLYSLDLYEKKEKKNLYVSYDEFNPYLDEILKLEDINITLENFPFCEVDEKNWNRILQREKYNNDAYGYIGDFLKDTPGESIGKCSECKQKEYCTGLPKDYIEIFG